MAGDGEGAELMNEYIKPSRLTVTERRLCLAFAAGNRLDLRRSPPEDTRVRAGVLVGLLIGLYKIPIGGVPALRLAGARVLGTLALEGAEVTHLIEFTACEFAEPPVLCLARLTGLRMRGSRLPGLKARNLRVGSDLGLEAGFTSTGVVDLTDASVRGTLRLAGAVLRGDRNGHALLGARLDVSGSLQATALRASGEVRLRGALVGGSVHFGGAHLTNPAGRALEAGGLRVGGSLHCDGDGAGWFTARGRVLLTGARVGGDAVFSGARLSSVALTEPVESDEPLAPGVPRGPSDKTATLLADRMEVQGDVRFDDGFTTVGEIRLRGADIRGHLCLSGATLGRPESVGELEALADGHDEAFLAELDREDTTVPTARQPVEPVGRTPAAGSDTGVDSNADAEPDADIEPDAEVNPPRTDQDARHRSRVPVAFFADGIRIGGDLEARTVTARGTGRTSSLRAFGQIRLVDARIQGSAVFSGAGFVAPGIDVLFADRLNVGGTLFLRDVRARGSLRMQNSHIGSTVDCTGAVLTDARRRSNGSAKPSLDVRVATIGKDLLCGYGFTATGGVRVRMAEVGKEVNFSGATLGGQDNAVALSAHGLQTARLIVRLARAPIGRVRLGRAQVTRLSDSKALWAATGGVELEDLTYDSISAPPDFDVRERLRVLRRVLPVYAPGPYERLAHVYRIAGDEEKAEEVQIEKERRRHAALGAAGQLWGWLQLYTVGFGYRPWRAMLWLTVFWLGGALWFERHQLVKLNNDENPVWNPWLLSADLLLPIVNLGQDGMWQINGSSQVVSTGLAAAGWILASTAAAGATRVLNRS